MKKSNIAVIAVAVIVSIFLLWLWYYLGFNNVDSPLDLVISIVWWIVIVAIAYGIIRAEKVRQEKIRTSYVADMFIFNSEAGQTPLTGAPALETLEGILKNLEYGFDKADITDEQKAAIKYVVRTQEYKPADKDSEEPTWKGEVATVANKGADPIKFASRAELAALIA